MAFRKRFLQELRVVLEREDIRTYDEDIIMMERYLNTRSFENAKRIPPIPFLLPASLKTIETPSHSRGVLDNFTGSQLDEKLKEIIEMAIKEANEKIISGKKLDYDTFINSIDFNVFDVKNTGLIKIAWDILKDKLKDKDDLTTIKYFIVKPRMNKLLRWVPFYTYNPNTEYKPLLSYEEDKPEGDDVDSYPIYPHTSQLSSTNNTPYQSIPSSRQPSPPPLPVEPLPTAPPVQPILPETEPFPVTIIDFRSIAMPKRGFGGYLIFLTYSPAYQTQLMQMIKKEFITINPQATYPHMVLHVPYTFVEEAGVKKFYKKKNKAI